MSWRSQSQRTGENAAPLQNARRWGGGGGGGSPADGNGYPGAMSTSSPYGAQDPAAAAAAQRAAEIAAKLAGGGGIYGGEKRDRQSSDAGPGAGDDGAPRKRRSRWGDAAPASGVQTAITGAVNVADLDRYALSVRLDEIQRKLQTGAVVPPDRERSPSPPPMYDGQGRRTNTREVRYRKKLEDERIQIVDKQLKLDPNYRPPAEYHASKRNRQPMEKVYLPLKEFPEINFFGLLVGPRGNTLKGMERQSGAKIAIRGKGSVKEGKGRGGDEDEEDMHCVITADDDAKVKTCIRLINQVIETAASTPESQNDHKRNQLRELATLNGTLRDDENQVCQNCGMKGHRRFECTEQRNYTAHITCHRCGGQGHLARDCTQPRQGFGGPPGMGGFGGMPGQPQQQGGPNGGGGGAFDSEYANLMAELGEGGRGGSGTPGGGGGPSSSQPGYGGAPQQQAQQQQAQLGPDGKKIPPWRQPDIWTAPGFGGPGGGGGFGGPRRGGYGGAMGGHMGGGGFGGPGPAAATGANAYGPTGGQGWGGAPAGGAAGGYGAPAAAAGGYGQPGAAEGQQQQQQQQQQDYSAEWAAYYAQQAQQQQAGGAGSPAAPGAAQPGAQQGGGAAAGSEQKDYTKEWEEYYRQQALMQQQQQGGGGGAGY